MPLNVAIEVAEPTFAPITINSLAELQAVIDNPPTEEFAGVTITFSTKTAIANILGALLAYGTANVYAENGLKAIGLGDYYSGNVRLAARVLAKEIADLAGFVPSPEFSAYLASVKYNGAKKSQAGYAVRGTNEDLAPGRGPTSFEPVIDSPVASVEAPATLSGTSRVW
jgi:hypothetical protein